jgi:hypothetical protein
MRCGQPGRAESGEAMNHQAEPGGHGLGDDSAAEDLTESAEPDVRPPTSDATESAAAATEHFGELTEPARPETGEPRVDAALTLLDRLAELPVTEHAAVFERVHSELAGVLGQLDPESADGG